MPDPAKIDSDLHDLAQWLADLVYNGLSNPQTNNPDFWETIAKRMNDAQLKTLASRLRSMAKIAQDRHEFTDDLLLANIASLHLLTQAYPNQDRFPPNLRTYLLRQLNYPDNKADLLELPGYTDHWHILHTQENEFGNVRLEKSWIQGQTSRIYAQIQQSAFKRAAFPHELRSGLTFYGSIIFYPSTSPQRAMIATYHDLDSSGNQLTTGITLPALHQLMAIAL